MNLLNFLKQKIAFTFFIVIIAGPLILAGNADNIKKIAVLPVKNSSNLAGVYGLTDSLRIYLSHAKNLQVVDKYVFNMELKKRSLEKKDPLNEKFARVAGKFVKADYLINGEFIYQNNKFEINFNIWEMNNGTIIKSINLKHDEKQGLINLFYNSIEDELAEVFDYSSGKGKINISPDEIDEQEIVNTSVDELEKTQEIKNTTVDLINEDKEINTIEAKTVETKNECYKEIKELLDNENYSFALKALENSLNNNCSKSSLTKAYIDATRKLIDNNKRFDAYSILTEVIQIYPEHDLNEVLADIHLASSKEELNDICIRSGPSIFYNTLKTVDKNEFLTIHSDYRINDNWIPVEIKGEYGDTTKVGWINKFCVKNYSDEMLTVINKSSKEEIKEFMDYAVVLKQDYKNRVFWELNKNYIIAGAIFAIILIVIITILVKV